MTSKEALNRLLKTIEVNMCSDEWYECVEAKNILEKDLEVLNALKRNVGIRLTIQEWANKETKVFPNDRKIVKEWLDEK